MTIEEIMLRDGWTMTKTMNAGKEYVEFHKNSLVIDGEGIDKKKIGVILLDEGFLKLQKEFFKLSMNQEIKESLKEVERLL